MHGRNELKFFAVHVLRLALYASPGARASFDHLAGNVAAAMVTFRAFCEAAFPYRAFGAQRPFAEIGSISESACCWGVSRRFCPVPIYYSNRSSRLREDIDGSERMRQVILSVTPVGSECRLLEE